VVEDHKGERALGAGLPSPRGAPLAADGGRGCGGASAVSLPYTERLLGVQVSAVHFG